ncbi:MAG: hypothetical protein ACAI38_17705 [Myxococcota bacterium]
MATVPAVDADPVVVAATPTARPLPPRIAAAIGNAGFPAELGDVSTFFRYTRLDATSPTVSHLLVNGGLSAYNRSGMMIQRAVMALNRAENPQWGMRNIRGEFIFFDPRRLAGAPEPLRAAALAALERLTQELGGQTTGPIEGDTDRVERPTRPRSTGPQPAAVRPPEPGTVARGAPLPQHAALEGITDEYRAWLTRGDNRMRTVEALLGSRPESFEAGLTAAAARHDIRPGGRHANIQQAAMALQTDLQVPGTPDGKFGRISTPILQAARGRYSGEQLASPEGRRAIRTELQGRDTLLAAVSEHFGADRPAEVERPAPVVQADPEPVTPRQDRLPVVVQQEPPVVTPPNPYQELTNLRTTNAAEYATRRAALVASAQGNAPTMTRIFTEAAAVNRDVAADLATAWLAANETSLLSGPEVLQSRRAFARLMSRTPAATSLPPALNDQLARILAPNTPSGPGLFSAPTGDDLAASTVFESARVARAQTGDALLRDDRDRYATFMWASPDVVARMITSLSASKPDVANEFGDAMARHLQSGGPVGTLDGRVDALYAIYQRLDPAARERVRAGMRGMGRIMGFNVTGIADHLVDRVTVAR